MTTARLLGAFLHRDWLVALSYRMQFFLEFLETIGEVVLLFYLGKFVDRGDFETDVGVTTDYFSFAALGLALLNLFFTALNAFSVTLRIEQTTGSLEALLTTPPPSPLLIMGSATYEFIRAGFRFIVFLGVGVLFFGLDIVVEPWPLFVAAIVMLASVVLFASLGLLVAAATVVLKKAGAAVGLTWILFALLGGVYFPLSLLPEPWQTLAGLIPFTWAVNALRMTMLEGVVDISRIIWLVVVACLLLPGALWILNLAINYARAKGSLAQY
ncbi:hypothetical protein BH24CHL3_BH24CHL3_01660 [soil metagenome]